MKLTHEAVEATFRDCLFKDSSTPEQRAGAVLAQGVTVNAGFDPERLAKRRGDIDSLLDQLPAAFHQGSGDGWSFLNLCNDCEGYQWTSFHQIMDLLVTLGIAVGRVQFCLPRESWEIFPGGMPYLVITQPREQAIDR